MIDERADGLAALADAMRRFADGDLSVRLDDGTAGALGPAYAGFNGMASAIQRRVDECERNIGESTRRLMDFGQLAFLGSLVAGMAHEINTQIGIGVTASSNLEALCCDLKRKYESSELTKSDLESAIAQSGETVRVLSLNLERAADFVKTLKTVATDQATGDIRAFRVKDYIETILFSLKPQLKRTSHAVSVECDEGLEVETSPGIISQIVTNMVVNSLVHGFTEGQAGKIVIRAKAEAGNLILCYSDNGKGMASEVKAHLFEPFFTTRKGKGGTGLGLYLIKQGLARLGGTIRCESDEGAGVLFTVALPVKVM